MFHKLIFTHYMVVVLAPNIGPALCPLWGSNVTMILFLLMINSGGILYCMSMN